MKRSKAGRDFIGDRNEAQSKVSSALPTEKPQEYVIKMLSNELTATQKALAGYEAKHESEVKKLWEYFRKQMARKQAKLASSEANIQEAYEQGVKDAIVDSRNESEAKIKELEEVIDQREDTIHQQKSVILEYERQLGDSRQSGIEDCAEKDKEIEAVKRVNKTLNDSLQSNSGDFWKGEAERLRKEKEEIYADIIHEGLKQVLSDFKSQLRDDIMKLTANWDKQMALISRKGVLELLEDSHE